MAKNFAARQKARGMGPSHEPPAHQVCCACGQDKPAADFYIVTMSASATALMVRLSQVMVRVCVQ